MINYNKKQYERFFDNSVYNKKERGLISDWFKEEENREKRQKKLIKTKPWLKNEINDRSDDFMTINDIYPPSMTRRIICADPFSFNHRIQSNGLTWINTEDFRSVELDNQDQIMEYDSEFIPSYRGVRNDA